jgi:hypothetical protein
VTAPAPPPEPHKPLAFYAPFVFGGVALVVGLALGVGRGGDPAAPAASATAGVSATTADTAVAASASPTAEGDRPAYVPDLSGDDIGQLIVKTDEPAAGVAIAGGRLLWLSSEGSRLSQVLPTGGEPEELFAVKGDEQFGGSMTRGDRGVYWVVEHIDGGSAPLYFLAPPRGKPRKVAEGNSPDHLAMVDGRLHWSDRGTIMKLGSDEEEPQVVAKRDKRIAALAGDARGIYWLEIDYQDGASGPHELMTLGPDGEEPRRIARFKLPRQRSMLVIRGDDLVWVEGREGKDWTLWAAARQAGSARMLASTGEISALAVHDAGIYWAEAHRTGADKVVTVLRRIAKNSNDAERLGRMSGAVTALAVDAGSLIAAGQRGIVVVQLP